MSGNGQGNGSAPSPGNRLATVVGQNLRAERKRLGITQRELARKVGGKVDSQRISDWERGAYRPNDDSLLRLGAICGREFAWFFVDRSGEPVERAA